MVEAAAPERQLKRALSAFDLTCIGIGAIIGTGIFALAGTAAAGEQAHAVGSIWKTPVLNFVQSWTTHAPLVFGRPGAGPAAMLSFVVAGIACGFAALCYAELAAMKLQFAVTNRRSGRYGNTSRIWPSRSFRCTLRQKSG